MNGWVPPCSLELSISERETKISRLRWGLGTDVFAKAKSAELHPAMPPLVKTSATFFMNLAEVFACFFTVLLSAFHLSFSFSIILSCALFHL